MSEYRPEKKRITVSVGESVRIIRELQELSQNQLSELTGIPQSTISAIENDRARLGGGARKFWLGP
jgi:transcriptional regulator with XRE-family HTH domain